MDICYRTICEIKSIRGSHLSFETQWKRSVDWTDKQGYQLHHPCEVALCTALLPASAEGPTSPFLIWTLRRPYLTNWKQVPCLVLHLLQDWNWVARKTMWYFVMQVFCGHKKAHLLVSLVSPVYISHPLFHPDPHQSRQENCDVSVPGTPLCVRRGSGREFDVWVTDPQVALLGSAWPDQFEAENSPGYTGNGCCWAWLSSLFIFFVFF